ncbi:S41 family peptidase [Candidatus Cyanaurora vandensis]|uniref:S41 family peptidase n=1 Tax=Candidatus Cyanaurora vandensis TaxID=2714958 RepID=UPI00257C0854|nr:S41 family peptidase [Candidatus Cyanaurora vandensis]
MEYRRRAVGLGLLGTVFATRVHAATGSDLDEVLQLFRNVALGERGTGIYLEREKQTRALIVAQDVTDKGQPPQQVEYRFLRDLIKKEGSSRDSFYDPAQVRQLLSIPIATVEGRSLEGGRVYLRLSTLEGGVGQVLGLLHRYAHDRGIVLDLRGATGDDPQTLADLARLFVAKTPLFFSALNKNQQQPHPATVRPIAQEVPLVLLVDGQTRGAAEALAGGLQLLGRARVLGTKTRGDGFRTALYELPSGAAVRLAMGRWQTEDRASLSPVLPDQEVTTDPLTRAINLLAAQPPKPIAITVFPGQGRIGKYKLGFDAGTGDLGVAGLVEGFGPDKTRRLLRPGDDLKVWYLGDYTVFVYRPQSSLFTFFADRIYTTSSNAMTEAGITLGSTYPQVVAAYGGSEQNGYVERFPFPAGARGDTSDRYGVDYDALGLSFLFASGTNRVVGIGLFKPGS